MGRLATLLKPMTGSPERKLASLLIIMLALFAGQAKAQQGVYCAPSYGSASTSGDYIGGFQTSGGTTNISNLSNLYPASGNYTFFNTMTHTAMNGQTVTYTIVNCPSWAQGIGIFIDWNQDFDFTDPGEYVAFHYLTGGQSATNQTFAVPPGATAGTTRMRVRCIYAQSSAASIDPCAYGSFGETEDYNFVVVPPPPCTGTPVVNAVSPAGPVNTCGGASLTLTGNFAIAGNLTYQWQISNNGGTTWTDIAGATAPNYVFTVTGSAQYRLKVTCTTSGLSANSPAVIVNATGPTYATIPYFQDFESWINYCGTNDVPSNNWTNQPSTGNRSWRRNDQGATANWTNVFSTYTPTSKSGSYSARFNTYGNSSTSTTQPGDLDLYLDCSGTPGNKQLYFYMMNPSQNYYWYDSLTVLLSTNGGASFTQIGGYDTATGWVKKTLPIVSNSAQTVLRFRARIAIGTYDYTDIGIDSVYIAAPCSGTPVAGAISPANPVGCSGSNVTLSLLGTSLAGGLNVQWEQSLDNTTWTNVVGGTLTGGGYTYTSPTLYDTIFYRVRVACGTGTPVYTSVVPVYVTAPQYSPLPMVEDFESWQTRCYTNDIPTQYWSNAPATGNAAWRRNDQGASAAWTSPTVGTYAPISYSGSYSARFHSYYAPTGSSGKLDLFVNCSTIAGNKELQFALNMPASLYAYDTVKVSMSTNGGTTFTPLATYITPGSGTWTPYTLPIVSNSATTVIRFESKMYYSYMTYYNDIGLDLVKVLPPCSGKPTAGTVAPANPCPNTPFSLSLIGSSQAAGLTYLWQQSTNSVAWSNLPGGTSAISSATISAPTYFRCIVTCTNGNQADTTQPLLITPALFYYCYCNSGPQYTGLGMNIGKVELRTQPASVTLLNNGTNTPVLSNATATATYTNFTNLTPITRLYRDSLYRAFVSQINLSTYNYATKPTIFIDYNRDGTFDPLTERVLLPATLGTSLPPSPNTVNDTFRVPSAAAIGITGMRVIMPYGTAIPNPCGLYNYGETEDYLVELSYPPCTGPSNAGTALVSSSTFCPDYPLTLTDTTYEKFRSGLTRVWQKSENGGAGWANEANSTNKDTIMRFATTATLWRVRMVCSFTGDTTYSNSVSVTQAQPWQCYPYSTATGGQNALYDSTDVGAFTIGNFVMNTGGPHLLNPTSVHGRTDYTNIPGIELWADSTYDVAVYHIMRAIQHKDAKVTLFMDFNNNLQYDPLPSGGWPSERVWTGYSGVSSWYVMGQVTIPSQMVIPNVSTGMRVVINENVGPNLASDNGVGTYTSGETEDYVVKFRKHGVTGVGVTGRFKALGLYPNPTTGKATLAFTADKPIEDLQITVSDLTGRILVRQSHKKTSLKFETDIDLSNEARGIYFVEIHADGEKMVRKLVVR